MFWRTAKKSLHQNLSIYRLKYLLLVSASRFIFSIEMRTENVDYTLSLRQTIFLLLRVFTNVYVYSHTRDVRSQVTFRTQVFAVKTRSIKQNKNTVGKRNVYSSNRFGWYSRWELIQSFKNYLKYTVLNNWHKVRRTHKIK